ncbi:putative death-receptor fusion protein [Glomus cerebriforme]|uniref:Putative death-receptor fusion protein n=1 Tax=Glomus cerebriforme TaxID=658196 RepID=A0A397TTQ3_9GLOM|nr:putative death-receptor fusion protein [Glomus cerebriforme]
MGFLEKNKPGKVSRTPITIDQSWVNILQCYLSNNSSEELYEGIQKIRELLYDKEATWEKQCQYIRSIGMSLPSKKSKSGQQSTNESLPSHVVNQIESIIEPIISGIYFSSITTLTKRICIPILDSCYMISDRNSFYNSSIQDQLNDKDNKMIKEFEQEYSRYITLDNYTSHLFSQKGISIYITLDFPLGFSTVENQLFETLRFLNECLSLIIQNVNEENEQKLNSASNSLSLSKHMNDAQHVIKTLLALLSRFDKKLRPQFESIGKNFTNNYNNNNKEEVINNLVRDLLNECLVICSDNTYIKDVRQLAGMTMAATLNLLGSSQFVSEQVMDMFFTNNEEDQQSGLNFLSHLGVKIPDRLFKEAELNGDDPLMLAICRGLLSNLDRKVLIFLLSGNVQFKISLLRSNDSNPKTLHHILFLSIAHFCDNALNSQTKVLAFETMGLWLQESENILRGDDVSKFIIHNNSSMFNPQVLEKLMSYVWNNWEDPVDAIQFKVKTIFEKLLDLISLKSQLEQSEEVYNHYLVNLLNQLLYMDKYRKVKYSLLLLLLPRVGTNKFLLIQPEFIPRTLEVLHNLVIAPRASTLMVAFFELRLEESLVSEFRNITIKEDEKREKIVNKWIDLWLVPICQGLTSSDDILRKNIGAFIIQPLFKASSSSFWRIIDILQNDKCGKEFIKNEQNRLNALIIVLKVGRSLDLVDGNMFIENSIDTNSKNIRLQFLYDAIYHSDLNLRIDMLGLICESRKLTNETTSTELALLKSFFQLNLNSTSPEFRQKLFGHLNKFFTKLKGNLYNQWKNYQSRIKYMESHEGSKVQEAFSEANQIKQKFDNSCKFLNWLIELLAASLYPGSSFQRVSSALRIFIILIKTFGIEKTLEGSVAQHYKTPIPLQLSLASARNTKLILHCLMNPFDENRTLAYEILQGFPSPLPGIELKDNVQKILFWALQSMTSTRAGESDSGAMIFRLIFSKYVLDLSLDLDVEIKQNESLEDYKKVDIPSNFTVNFTRKLFSLLKKQINIASENLLLASQKFPMHGTLLALQYIFKELDYNSLEVKNNFEEWRDTHSHAINLINEVCQIVLGVLSNPSPEGNVPASFQEMEEMIDELVLNLNEDLDSVEEGPKHQVILSCCWRAVKEASSLLAIILLRAPMAISLENNFSILDYEKIRKGGDLFRTLLTSIRHRGAFSAVYPGYVAVCARLLNSPQVKFIELPKIWLEDNINSIMANSISITRRSAGLPLCILAIVSSEPNNRKVLLPWTMKTLIEIGSQAPLDDFDQTIDLPQVHAFNILRTIFMDAKLGTDVLPYVSDGFILAIKGFSSPSWAVRNCSVMLFSTLLQRTFGTKKTKDEHHSINKLTGREFFSRFPQLYPFLLDELKIAVDQLIKSTKVFQSTVHPGLYPVLTLLSRLHPSLMDGSSSVLTMKPFVSLVLSCTYSPIYKTREMAARAIVPLISSNDLIVTCTKLINEGDLSNQNELHGKLVQVQYLMRGHLNSNVANFDVMKDFIIKMASIFKSKIHFAFRKNSCNITRYLYLDILYEFIMDGDWIFIEQNKNKIMELLELMEDKFFEIRQLLFDMSLCDFFDINYINKNQDMSKVGYYLVRQQMARIIIKCLINQENPEHSQIIIDILSDSDYEVRLVGLEMLINFFNSNNYKEIRIDKLMLQCKIIEMIFKEEFYQNCFQKAVELLTLVDSENPFPKLTSHKSLDFGLEEFWKKLFNYMEHAKSSTKTEATLPLLGSLLSQIWQDNSLPRKFKSESLNQWCKYIDKNTKPEITLTLREATTRSLKLFSQHLFKDFKFSKSEDIQQTITLYLVLVRLAQDDDIDLRHTAALIISKASGLKASIIYILEIDCDRAREICFEYMTKSYSKSLHLYVALLQTITGNVNPDETIKIEINPTRVLFVVENPNIYKEDLIDIQLAYKHLKFAFNKEGNVLDFPDVFKRDIPRFAVEQLRKVCELLRNEEVKASNNKNNGILGFTSRPIIFVVVYRVIITVLVMLEIVSNKQEIINELAKDKIQLHPLLNEILFEGFNHYFDHDSRIIINDEEKFDKEFERLFLLSN